MQHQHNHAQPASQANREPEHGPDTDRRVVSSVETDLFCEGCGYNLRTQKVWEEPTTRILVIQCPECNKCHAARGIGGAKLAIPDRLVQLAAIGWVLFLGLLFIGTAGIEMVILLVLTEQITRLLTSNYGTFTPLFIGFLLPGVLSMTVGGMIAILSSSPTLTWAHRLIALRFGIYLAAIGLMAVNYYIYKSNGPNQAMIIMMAGLLVLASQYIGGMIGVYLGRPAFDWLCRNLLPASIVNMIRAHWSSQTAGAPVGRRA